MVLKSSIQSLFSQRVGFDHSLCSHPWIRNLTIFVTRSEFNLIISIQQDTMVVVPDAQSVGDVVDAFVKE